MTRAEYAKTHEPACHECACSLCVNHTLAYLHHLFKANEPTAVTLAATHNLHFMGRLMREQREAILNDEM